MSTEEDLEQVFGGVEPSQQQLNLMKELDVASKTPFYDVVANYVMVVPKTRITHSVLLEKKLRSVVVEQTVASLDMARRELSAEDRLRAVLFYKLQHAKNMMQHKSLSLVTTEDVDKMLSLLAVSVDEADRQAMVRELNELEQLEFPPVAWLPFETYDWQALLNLIERKGFLFTSALLGRMHNINILAMQMLSSWIERLQMEFADRSIFPLVAFLRLLAIKELSSVRCFDELASGYEAQVGKLPALWHKASKSLVASLLYREAVLFK